MPDDVTQAHRGGVNVWNLQPRELNLRRFIIPLSINLKSVFTGDLITKDDKKSDDINRIVVSLGLFHHVLFRASL